MKYRIVMSVVTAGLLAVMGCADKPADTLPEDNGLGTSPSIPPVESSASFVVVATDVDAGAPDASPFEANGGVIIQRPGTIGADDDGTK